MKQTKKLTRNQRILLEKHHIDTEGVRCICETKEYLDYLSPKYGVQRLEKGGKSR